MLCSRISIIKHVHDEFACKVDSLHLPNVHLFQPQYLLFKEVQAVIFFFCLSH